MKRWARRCCFSLALIVAAALLLLVIGLSLLRSTPAWYAPVQHAPAEREQLAQTAENKLITAQNWAAEVRADAVRSARAFQSGSARPATRAADSHVVHFTQDELNALFHKWSIMYGWSDNYRKFVESPTLILRGGRIIIAGKVIDLRTIVSMHFEPRLDEQGRLRLDLVKVRGGRLPLPESFWKSWRDQADSAIRKEMPHWQEEAKIAPSGAANTDAMTAAMGQLFLRMAQRQSAEPVLFMPLADDGDSVPVKLAGVEVEDGRLKLAVVPMTASERAELLTKIKSRI